MAVPLARNARSLMASSACCRFGDPRRLGREGERVFYFWQDQLAEEVVRTVINRERSPSSVLQVRIAVLCMPLRPAI